MRVQYYETITSRDPDGTMKALAGVTVTVFNRGLTTRPNIWAKSTDTAPIPNSSFITVDGSLNFWVDPGSYELHFEDTVSPSRIDPDTKLYFEALPASDNTIPGAKIADVSIDEDKLAQLVGSSFAQALINKMFAPGDTKSSYQTADHSGWLLMNGRNDLLVSDYPALGALMQARGFLGIDANHFAIPDNQGRVQVGMGTHGEVNALTKNDGIADVSQRRATHSHGATGLTHPHTHGMGSHTHGAGSYGAPDHLHSSGGLTAPDHVHNLGGTTGGGPGGGTFTTSGTTAIDRAWADHTHGLPGTTGTGWIGVTGNTGGVDRGLGIGGTSSGPSTNTSDAASTSAISGSTASAGAAFQVTNFFIKT